MLAVEFSEPVIVVPEGLLLAAVSTGKFCSPLGPVSLSPMESLPVTPLSPRSMPCWPLATRWLARRDTACAWVAVTTMPSAVLCEMRLTPLPSVLPKVFSRLLPLTSTPLVPL